MPRKKKTFKKKLESVQKSVKDGLNINKYNKWLFIFETVLLVGVLDEFLEGVILDLPISFYWHVALVMLCIGIVFSAAFIFIEKYAKKIVIGIIRFSNNKLVRIILHLAIIAIIFYLYARVFFGTKVALDIAIGVTAT